MRELTASQFRADVIHSMKYVISHHEPLKITHVQGHDVVLIPSEDWNQMQETLYVLQNHALMQQIAESLTGHLTETGYIPTSEELDEIVGV